MAQSANPGRGCSCCATNRAPRSRATPFPFNSTEELDGSPSTSPETLRLPRTRFRSIRAHTPPGKPTAARAGLQFPACHRAAKLRKRFDTGQVALGVETSRGPVISALMSYDFIVLFPINPKALKDYRAAF